MKTMNRRNLLASSAVAAVALGAPAFAQEAAEPDAAPKPAATVSPALQAQLAPISDTALQVSLLHLGAAVKSRSPTSPQVK